MSEPEERGAAGTTALAHVAATEVPPFKLATSLASIKRGEVLLLDPEGRTLTQRTINRRLWALGGVLAAGTVVLVTASSPPLVFGAAGMIGALAIRIARPMLTHVANPEARRGLRFMMAHRDAEARIWLERAAARGRRGVVGATVANALGTLAWRRGDHVEARRHTERALLLASRRGDGAVTYWIVVVQRAQLLAMHDPEAAVPLIADLANAPSNEFFVGERRYAELSVAFHTDRPDRLPADELLYDWAKEALGQNASGFRLAALAWVFDRRGDAEMSAHLLGEVRSHLLIDLAVAPNIDPALWAWVEPRLPPADADP